MEMDSSQRKQMIRQAFDTVAQGYDHPSMAFFPETAKRMVQLLQLDPRAHLLDVCTGTGVVAIEAARMLGQGKVTAIDLSPGMLAQARNKAEQQRLDNVEFIQADLDYLDFPAHHFDVITSSFGLFFMEDMQAVLSRILTMLKPGGKLAISSFVDSAFSPMSDLFLSRYEDFGREAPPLSWKRISTEQALRDLFGSVGVDSVKIYPEALGCYMNSPQDWWDIVWNAGYRGLLNQLNDDEQVLFKQQHLAEIQQLCDAEQTWLDTGVNIAIARKS